MKTETLMRVLMGVALTLGLAAILLMAACAKPAPTPTPPPTVAPSPTAKPITQIMIAGGRVGDAHQVLSEALAYFINKKSTWLRATVVATPGLAANDELVRDNPTKYIAMSALSNLVHMPKGAQYKNYDGMRTISPGSSGTYLFVTYDKNLKTVKDLAGKVVNLGREGSTLLDDHLPILREAGVLEKVKTVKSGYGTAVTNMKDGLVHVAVVQIDHVYPAGFSKGQFVTDLETRAPVYYVSLDPVAQEKLYLKGDSSMPVRIFPGALDAKTQTGEVWGGNFVPMFGADIKMDADVVYEVTRVLYESAGEFGVWHVQGQHLTKEFIPTYLIKPELIHPGALKYYKEKGIQMKDLASLLR